MNEGVRLAARFALPAYRNGACGTGTLPVESLMECAAGGSCQGVRNELSHFATLYPYLKTAGHIMGQEDPFQLDAVKAYWLGGGGLFRAKPEHFDFLLAEMLLRGFPIKHLPNIKRAAPKRFVPFHLYHILLGHELSGGNLAKLHGVNNCMVRYGVIKEVSGQEIGVSLLSLVEKEGQFKFEVQTETVAYDVRVIESSLKPGSTIAVHLGWVCEDLTEDKISSVNLLYWTKEVVTIYNQHRADR